MKNVIKVGGTPAPPAREEVVEGQATGRRRQRERPPRCPGSSACTREGGTQPAAGRQALPSPHRAGLHTRPHTRRPPPGDCCRYKLTCGTCTRRAGRTAAAPAPQLQTDATRGWHKCEVLRWYEASRAGSLDGTRGRAPQRWRQHFSCRGTEGIAAGQGVPRPLPCAVRCAGAATPASHAAACRAGVAQAARRAAAAAPRLPAIPRHHNPSPPRAPPHSHAHLMRHAALVAQIFGCNLGWKTAAGRGRRVGLGMDEGRDGKGAWAWERVGVLESWHCSTAGSTAREAALHAAQAEHLPLPSPHLVQRVDRVA